MSLNNITTCRNITFSANYNKSNLSSAVISRTDSELENKVKKTSERICENLHIIANEPSLAFYRISEHVRKVSDSLLTNH